ncbi:MAG: hypothetical protein RLZZ584_134 [Pseudomonadota bacterium]|jgi:hypothetical protein
MQDRTKPARFAVWHALSAWRRGTDLHNPPMLQRTRSHAFTRLLLAWLIVCVGALGMLPALATPSTGGAPMDELCSVAMGLASADAGAADAGTAYKAGHEHCAVCVVANVAAPPAVLPAVVPALADFHGPVLAPALHGAQPAALWQARGPPALASR